MESSNIQDGLMEEGGVNFFFWQVKFFFVVVQGAD